MWRPRGLFAAILQSVFIAQPCLPIAEIDNPSIDVSRFNVRGEIKRLAVGNGFNLPHRVRMACRTAFTGRCPICGSTRIVILDSLPCRQNRRGTGRR
jgi:hypothetical protein